MDAPGRETTRLKTTYFSLRNLTEWTRRILMACSPPLGSEPLEGMPFVVARNPAAGVGRGRGAADSSRGWGKVLLGPLVRLSHEPTSLGWGPVMRLIRRPTFVCLVLADA